MNTETGIDDIDKLLERFREATLLLEWVSDTLQKFMNLKCMGIIGMGLQYLQVEGNGGAIVQRQWDGRHRALTLGMSCRLPCS